MSVAAYLRRLGEHATAGPWSEQAGSIYEPGGLIVVEQVISELAPDVEEWPSEDDAEFIVSARNLWEPLLAVVEAAEAARWNGGEDGGLRLRRSLAELGRAVEAAEKKAGQ